MKKWKEQLERLREIAAKGEVPIYKLRDATHLYMGSSPHNDPIRNALYILSLLSQESGTGSIVIPVNDGKLMVTFHPNPEGEEQ